MSDSFVQVKLKGRAYEDADLIMQRDGDTTYTNIVNRALRALRSQNHVLRESSQMTRPSSGQENHIT